MTSAPDSPLPVTVVEPSSLLLISRSVGASGGVLSTLKLPLLEEPPPEAPTAKPSKAKAPKPHSAHPKTTESEASTKTISVSG